jgi:hypothetical protein
VLLELKEAVEAEEQDVVEGKVEEIRGGAFWSIATAALRIFITRFKSPWGGPTPTCIGSESTARTSVYHIGGPIFDDNPKKIRLANFCAANRCQNHIRRETVHQAGSMN